MLFNPPSRSETSRLMGYLRPYKRAMVIAIVALLAGSLLGLVFPWIMQDLVNSVFAESNMAELNRITAILIFTFLLRSIFYYYQIYWLSFVGERIVVDLRRQVYSRLHEFSLGYFADQRIGELISRLSSDVTVIRGALTSSVASVLSQTVTFIGSLILMLVLNWRLTLFILVLAPLVVLSALLFGFRLRRRSAEVQDQLAGSTALAEEALSNVRIVKAFTREPYEVERYNKAAEETFQATMSLTTLRAAFGPLISFLGFASLAAILWFGGREVLAGRLTAGALIAFLVYGSNIAGSVSSFANLYTQIQEAAGASRRVFGILDDTPDIANREEALNLPRLDGRLTFEDVSFAYSEAEQKSKAEALGENTDSESLPEVATIAPPNHVLHHITLEIQPGEVLALVGPSGAGKSTLFNLIPRFYDPSEGRICVDGVDLRDTTLESLRGQIGLVPQETQLFSATIRENLRYGNLEASDTEIETAARAANAEEFILRLANGYETQVGERGVKLSGGQRQRVAIARALLKNPRILLLDEATSSLDSESEGLVQEALERLMHGRTTVVIAHRLSTIQNAQRIAVLDQGNLIELGSHSELMAMDGLYARLYRLQFQERVIG
jgi:ATP-binding cassette, subfamily B, bacterial MsbA